MKSTFNSSNQFWTEIAASAGLIGSIATNTTASSCLTTWEAARAQAICDFGVTNGYWRPHMINEFLVLLDKVLRRYPGAAD
jgi:hypothetical protein